LGNQRRLGVNFRGGVRPDMVFGIGAELVEEPRSAVLEPAAWIFADEVAVASDVTAELGHLRVGNVDFVEMGLQSRPVETRQGGLDDLLA
jgi:hypothetical protein